MSLSEDVLQQLAGDRIFQRGEDYVRYVHGLHVVGTSARGSIQAKRIYAVRLDWSGPEPRGSCTCPHFADGHFCKHLVALGLAAIDATDAAAVPSEVIDAYLDRLDEPALRDLVRDLVSRDPAAGRVVAARADGPPDALTSSLLTTVDDALTTRGFVDYRRSFDVARDADELLDELERHLYAGAADAVRPALLRATTELRTLGEHADDSAGVLGAAGQRAADLHARSCRDGSPDGVALARWLVGFRASSPGWPETPLAAYVDAFDEAALAEYAAGVDRLAEERGDLGTWDRSDVDTMLLELADHRGDVDAAIGILARGDHPRYGAVIDRLRAAGRDDEVLGWTDRGRREHRISDRLGEEGRDYWLLPSEVADTYLTAGRERDALDVLRSAFAASPGFAAFTQLLSFADPLGLRDAEREWALAAARATLHYARGPALVEIALGEGDLGAAWAAAHEFGPGHRWRELAEASRETMPREAADLHRPGIEQDLRHPHADMYPKIADDLVVMRDLYARAGAEADFAAYVADIRTRFGRRPSLMAALDRRHL